VTKKIVVYWDIKTQFIPHRRHYVSATEASRLKLCKIELFTVVTMKNVVYWDMSLVLYILYLGHYEHSVVS
jgi:hypothetical protein